MTCRDGNEYLREGLTFPTTTWQRAHSINVSSRPNENENE